MAFSGYCSSSVLLAVGLVGLRDAECQSSHLTTLELAVPATAPDGASAIALGGWTSAWLAPGAAGEASGVMVGIERSGFAALTTTFAAVRLRAGPVWQLSFAQSRVSDLFDDALLDQFPELATLRAAATLLGIDARVGLGWGAGVSVGGRYERDEFLGDAGSAWTLRVSASAPRVLGIRSAAVLERTVAGSIPNRGAGRLRFGLARSDAIGVIRVSVGLGAVLDDTWNVSTGRTRLAGSIRLTLFKLVALSGALGAARDQFGADQWYRFTSVGIGIAVGQVAADFRYGGSLSGEAMPFAMSLLYSPD